MIMRSLFSGNSEQQKAQPVTTVLFAKGRDNEKTTKS